MNGNLSLYGTWTVVWLLVCLPFKQIDFLTIAPAAVGFLSQLSCLQLQNNNIQELPSELWRLTNLEELNLGHNQLKLIPKEIRFLTRLKGLFLHSNNLESIPSEIGQLGNMTVLDLSDNQLTFLPAELLSLKLLQFWTEGNDFCIENIYPTILSLRSICSQTLGIISSTDTILKTNMERKLPFAIKQEILQETQCTACGTSVFHSDSFILHNKYLSKVCSQTCLLEIKKEING
ncbi:hypothetical protein BY458DRAFT_511113 [Sporodiniella umbellata]|nr:hypothetical protein BY458DRAFT_511113 [Sporodiniella umbellata]